MLRNKGKGQGLVEFALILPILLLLLLGIVEGARIIWAFITVQNAAREAARYAVTGRPFACGGDPAFNPDYTVYCDDSSRGDPWSTQVLTTTRVAAIKEVARGVGRNLAVSVWADADLGTYNLYKSTPGAFGIAVLGQSPVFTQGLYNYAGEPGWNVRVETYYNVKMIDPIYDVLMGGQTIHLSGQVELQNEGIDATAQQYIGGILPDLADNCYEAGTCGGGSVPFISVIDENNDFIEPQGGSFTVSVNDHLPNTTYRIYFTNGAFSDYREFTTDSLGGYLINFPISVSAPTTFDFSQPDYRIYTALVSNPAAPVATCLGDLQTNTPCFSVDRTTNARIIAENIEDTVTIDGEVYTQKRQPTLPARWPISSSIPIYLFGHDTNADYNVLVNGSPVTLNYGNGSTSAQIRTDANFGSNQNNPAYFFATGRSPGTITLSSRAVADGSVVADTTVQLTRARLEVQGETPTSTHPQGDIVTISLWEHAPQQEYRIYFQDGVSNPVAVRVDNNGVETFGYIVPYSSHTPGEAAIPVDIFTLDHGRGPNPNIIARRTIWLYTPVDPYINVPGGNRWPAGSPITIQLRQHTPDTDYEVYIENEQGTLSQFIGRVRAEPFTYTDASGNTRTVGQVDLNYEIPFSFTGLYTIRSYLPTDRNNPIASYEIRVTANPYISVDGGKRWPPGASVVVRLQGHAANTPYRVWLDKDGPQEFLLGTVVVNGEGEGTVNYTIPLTMPSRISPDFYPIHSYLNTTLTADNGELEVYPADLQITRIDVPSVITAAVEIPITLTIANRNPVTITNTYFDADIYVNPPVPPDPLNNGLPPGDYKQWVNNMPPSGTITIDDTIVLFGQQSHQIYGRVDTTRNVAESNESNNVTLKSLDALCPVEVNDEFDDGLVDAASTYWTPTDFGNSATATSTRSESNGILTLTNRGSSALTANDSGSSAGYHFYNRPVGSGPFEVYVRLNQTALNGTSGRAGLEVRANTTSTSDKLMLLYRSNNSLQVVTRRNGVVDSPAIISFSSSRVPIWLRIRRNGDEFNFSYVPGATSDTPPAAGDWVDAATVSNFIMPDSVLVGLVNAPASTSSYTARFKHFRICASAALGGVSTGGSRCGQVEENGNGLVVVDAVNTILNQTGGNRQWTSTWMDNVLGEPFMEGLAMTPDSGANLAVGAGPHATYQVNVQSGGTYYVWLAASAPDANGDSVFVRLNNNPASTLTLEGTDARGVAVPTGSSSGWVKVPGSLTVNAGINTINLWGREDGFRLFKIVLTQNNAFVPPADGMAQSACTIISQPHIPPLLRQCINPIRYGDFEGTLAQVTPVWPSSGQATVRNSAVVYNGNFAAAFPTYENRQPKISQTFNLPSWLLANTAANTATTASLNLWRGVDRDYQFGPSSPADQLYFTLRYAAEPAPPAAGFDLITPILLASGDPNSGLPDLDSFNPLRNQWTGFNQDILAGLNPLSILEPGAAVTAYFYSPNPGQATAFYLDDVSLTFCTQQPAPAQNPALGRITGITRRSGQPQAGVNVWAYAYSADGSTPGPVFKTYSIQDGTFRFFNLPPGQYLLYANLTDGNGSFFATFRVPVSAGSDIRNIILNVVTG